MLAQKRMPERDDHPISESDILQQIVSGAKDAVEIGQQLPEMRRAQIAQFCYNRVHMRELGLRLAATCDMLSLRNAFGRAADVVFEQSRDVDATLAKLKNPPGGQTPRPVTLKGHAGSD